jgi:uncharacterized protein involved in exopolysaccharide biosynthesis
MSRDLAREFIEQQQLLPILFAEKWDKEAKDWKSSDPLDRPDLRDAVQYFDQTVRTVSEDRRTALVTVAITWKDPVESARWANLLVAHANRRLREQALSEAQRNVDYLSNELAETTVASLRQSIGTVLESEMQKLLFARGRDEFAFKVIDPATTPKYRLRPRRTIIVIFSLMLGAALAPFVVLLRSVRTRHDGAGRTVS